MLLDGAILFALLCRSASSATTASSKTSVPATTTFSIKTAPNAGPSASAPTVDGGKAYIDYSTVGGFFLQDLNKTNATTFDYTATNFGLINQTYIIDCPKTKNLSQWQRFNRLLYAMNQGAPSNVVYKLLFIGRHGEGYHNTAESYFGTPAWNCYYGQFDGNSTTTWSDAKLTPNGIAQAQKAHDFWASEFETQGIQAPQSYYVSPLTRCLQTAQTTYSNLSLPAYYPFIPTVKEFFRESISIRTCDRRSRRAQIKKAFPDFLLDPTLTQDDELWNGLTAETSSAQQYRNKLVLDSIFSSDPSTIISITTHSGEARSLLSDLGHIPFSLNTGAIIPLLVKAQTVTGKAPATSTLAWTAASWCTNGPPKSSQTTGASQCVCSDGVKPVTALATPTRVPHQEL